MINSYIASNSYCNGSWKLGASIFSNVNTMCVFPCILIDSFHHGFQLLHGATFIKLCDTILDHVLNILLPQYWGCNLRCQILIEFSWVRARPLSNTADVHVQVYFREMHVWHLCPPC